jgi:lantibiotic modifying enzyme
VAFILSAEDLISDNLIVFNGSPLLIDCEVFSSPPRFVSINDNPLTFINSSVLSTGLLPHDFDENRSFPSSPLVKASGKAVSKLNHFEVEGGKSVFEENYHNLIPTYLPISNNKGYTVHKFKSSFIKGFRVMVSDPEYLEKINMFLSGLTFSRLLARNTQDYDHVLRESNRPKYLKSEKATLNFLSKVISGKDKFPNFHKEEINQLLRGDIPFFYTNAKTRGIYNPNKESVETVVFSHSPYEHFLDRLSLLSDKKFVVKQVSIINNTIFHSDSLDNNLFEVFGDTSFLVFSESGKKIIREAILDYLKSSSIVIDDELFFTGIAHDGVSPTYSFSLIDEDLYAGSGGVLLVLLMIKDEYWDPLIKKKLDAIVKEAVDFLILDMSAQSDINDVKFISAFHFPSIILHFIFAGYISGTLSKEIITLYELWIIRRFKHDTIGDYLLGMSSVIHLVFNNASYFTQNFLSSIESRYYQMLKKKCFQYKDSIYFKFFERTEELNVGLCHGNIGVAVALSSILKYQNSSEIKNLLVEVFKYICYSIDDNKLDFFSNHQKERLTLPSYNHGISGLVVLLIENPDLLVSERRKRLFEKFISDVIHFSSNINNFTLANGAIGNIIIALWLLQKEEKRSLISPNIRSDFQLFINKITVHDLFRNSHSPKMFLNPDLYGGLTGLLYLLLFKDSKHTYNIFSFQKS